MTHACSNVPGNRTGGPQACGRAPRPTRRADSEARPAGVMTGGRRPARARVIALTVLTATAALTSACGGNNTAGALQEHLLSAPDLPGGWSAAPVNPKTVQTNAPCLSGPLANSAGFTYAAAGFVQGTVIPTLGEVLATGPQAKPRWRTLSRALAHCRTATITIAGNKAPVTITPLSFPRSASTTAAYAWTFTIAGIGITDDLVLFEAGQDTGYLSYSDLGTADRLDPLANSQTLARLIPGAKLTLYPDAGHAFLFQDQAAFITLIESFPG